MCWLLWFSCHYLPSDWLERPLRGHLNMVRRLPPQSPGGRACLCVFFFCLVCLCSYVFPRPCTICISYTHDSLFVLKVTLNPNQPINLMWILPELLCALLCITVMCIVHTYLRSSYGCIRISLFSWGLFLSVLCILKTATRPVFCLVVRYFCFLHTSCFSVFGCLSYLLITKISEWMWYGVSDVFS